MAVFDPVEQRMCVRVVYDGVAGAGKTTNLQQLCAVFATQRTTELYTPEALDGRTLYFDWVQIAAGVVCGFPLMCQVISVPGHVVLTPRRRHLLASADVVVYVCDSSPGGIERARDGLSVLREIGRDRGAPVPLLLQANKQDQVGALDAGHLLDRLGCTDVPSVTAIASEGIGVVDTFVHAVRLVSRAMQARSEATVAPLRIEVRRPDQPSEVLAALANARLDPELAAEMVLEEALSAFLFADDAPVQAAAFTPPRVPLADVPTGFIWPAHTGRATLERLHETGDLQVDDRRFSDPGGATVSHVFEHDAGTHLLRTTRTMRFDDAETARQALVRAARERTQLGDLLATDTVLVAQSAADGSCWIWRVAPKMPALTSWLPTLGDTEIAAMLRSYGVALAGCVAVSLRHDLSVDLSVSAFAVQGGRIRYVGEIGAASPAEHESLASAAVRSIRSLGLHASDLAVVSEAFERELTRLLGHDETARVLHRSEAAA